MSEYLRQWETICGTTKLQDFTYVKVLEMKTYCLAFPLKQVLSDNEFCCKMSKLFCIITEKWIENTESIYLIHERL